MPDPWLAPRLPLDDVLPRSEPRFSLADMPPASRFIFRGAEQARGACSRAFNADLPQALGLATVGDGRAAIWLGPDEWLLIAEGVDPEVVAAEIEAALSDDAPQSRRRLASPGRVRGPRRRRRSRV